MTVTSQAELFGLGDKVALVTGAGSGIGRAAARLLAAHGARVAVLSRTRAEVEQSAALITGDGGEALALDADVSDWQALQRAVDAIDRRWGRLDAVLVNAGINGLWAPLAELDNDEWRRTLEVNLTGTFLTVKAALPHLKKRGGAVAVTASVNGTRMFSNSGATAYACSKAAQVAFVKMTALELASQRIRVNAICPGAIETAIDDNTRRLHLERAGEPAQYPEGAVPLSDGRPGSAEQVAKLALFLLSDMADHITGTEVWIDGAQSLLQG